MPEVIHTGDNELLNLMRAREEREAKVFAQQEKERQDREAGLLRRIARREEGDKYEVTMTAIKQSKCDHRKGTNGKKKFKVVDYNLSRYTFQGGVTRIKCEKCRFLWYPGDTKELAYGNSANYLAKGKRNPNPTKLSYADVWQMSEEDSTNTAGRCEVIASAQGPTPQVA